MDEAKLKSLLDEASERYNEGLYDEAIARWREALALDPSSQKAREGIRMASLLTADWADASQTATETGGDPEGVRERIEAGVARVKQLAEAGQYAEALEGCDLLSEIAPDREEVSRLKDQVQRASAARHGSSPAGGIEQHLETARQALSDGRNREAAAAANKALKLDPSNMEACGILSMAAEDAPDDSPVTIGGDPRRKGPDFETGPFAFEETAGAAGASGPGETAASSGDQDPRVAALITEGRDALSAGRPEEAIAIWSRIFAYDRANAEAGTLIDRAKSSIEEQARRVDELYYKAVDANEAGRREEAIDLFQQVLSIAPNHPDARSSMEELKARVGGLGGDLDAGFGSLEEPKPQPEIKKKKPAAMSAAVDLASVPLADLGYENPHPHRTRDARREVAVKPAILAPRKSTGNSSRFLVATLGSLVVAAAGVGAWLWLGNGIGSMPEAEATTPVAVKIDRKPQGQAKPAPGGPPPAIEVVPGAAPKVETPAPPAPAALNPEQLKAQAAALTREGRQYFQQERWAEAVITFKKAIAADPVDFDAQDQLDEAMDKLQKAADLEREMGLATKYFAEGDYAAALHKFYRLQQDRSEMKILETYIKNSWFNWGVLMLQSGSVDEAVEKFDEALQIDPRDPLAARARDVAKRYHGRPRDSVYDAFTNALQLRSLDQR